VSYTDFAPVDRRPARTKVPRCFVCGGRLATIGTYWLDRHKIRPLALLTGDAPERGYEGNNLVCSQRCGYDLAIALLLADRELLRLLPPEWRKLSANRRARLGPHDRADCPCGHPVGTRGPCAGCNCGDPAP
jgi:hypothetical protein